MFGCTLNRIFIPVARAVEYILVNVLFAAGSCLHVRERVFDPENFVFLADNITDQIEACKAELR